MSDRSYVINSFIVGRGQNPWREAADGCVVLQLDRYAVVPLEQYEEHLADVRKIMEKTRKDAFIAKQCIHCDPTFIPAGNDDWCSCKCHNNDF